MPTVKEAAWIALIALGVLWAANNVTLVNNLVRAR